MLRLRYGGTVKVSYSHLLNNILSCVRFIETSQAGIDRFEEGLGRAETHMSVAGYVSDMFVV
jgi:hypothetical protein